MAAPKKRKKAKTPNKKANGRPDTFTQEKADRICELISTTTYSLRTICKMEGMPSVQVVLKWLREDRSGFQAQYARAKEEQADFMGEEMIEIADDGTNDYMTITKGDITYNVEDKEVTNRSKLRVETRKWLMGKLKPKKYGEKLDMELTGKDGGPIETKFDITLNLNK
jgi:hypothetical protein